MKLSIRRTAVLVITLLLSARGYGAELKVAQVFQDHMVLQRGKPAPIWGWANPGDNVTVTFGGKKASAKADANGYWKATLPAMDANRTGQAATISDGANSLTLNDVLVGEVWVCAVQIMAAIRRGRRGMAREPDRALDRQPGHPRLPVGSLQRSGSSPGADGGQRCDSGTRARRDRRKATVRGWSR